MFAVMRAVSPEKSTKVTRPGSVVLGAEMATANFCGCAAGPTGLMALTTGRKLLPHPATKVKRAAAKAILDAARMDWVPKLRVAKGWATNRRGLRRGRDCVFPAASILAKCKTAPTLLL